MPVPHATGYMTPDSNIPYARHTPNIMNMNDNNNTNNNNRRQIKKNWGS